MKQCTKCFKEKSLNCFSKDKAKKDGLQIWCRSCGNLYKKNQRRTKEGLLKTIYNNQIKSSKQRGHPQPEYTKLELFEWALSQDIFHKLHKHWVDSNYEKDLVPSLDRKDDYKHYIIGNIQIMTFRENYLKSHNDRKNGINNKTNKAVIQMDLKGNKIKEFYSISEACREYNLSTSHISEVCNGILKTTGGYKWKYKEG